MLHGHPSIRDQAVRRLLCRPGREDHRQILPQSPHPVPAHLDDPPPHSPVRVAAAAILPLRPVHLSTIVETDLRPDRAMAPLTQDLLPVCLQRQHPHGSRCPGPCSASAGTSRHRPARTLITVSAVMCGDMRIHSHRSHCIPRVPVIGHPRRGQPQNLRGQTRDTHPREHQEAMGAQHPGDVLSAGIVRPANPVIPRLQLKGR